MRTLLRLSTSVLVLTAVACGGDNTGPGGNTNGDMTAKIDGSSFTSVATFATRNATNAGSTVALSGANSAGTGIGIGFLDAGPGTYSITNVSATNANVLDSQGHVWVASVLGGDGTVTITAIDATHVAGTFSFNAVASAPSGATGTKAVTNGSFDIKF